MNDSLKIVFTPDNSNKRYFRTPQSEVSLNIGELNYYTNISLNLGSFLSHLSIIAVVVGWVGIFVGIIAKTLAGI